MPVLRIDPRSGQIPIDFQDDFLELIWLLDQAAGLEHSLLVAYLYAVFSIKDEYASVRGDLTIQSYLEHSSTGRGGDTILMERESYLAVALEEMQHLSLVNRLLTALGAAPNLMPQVFPFSCDLYPFDIDLRPMDRFATATHLWVEADPCALSTADECAEKSEPREFIDEVVAVLKSGGGVPIDQEPLNHLGSLYHSIIEQLAKVAARPPAFLDIGFPWGDWDERMHWILDQGEVAHYRFFRRVFTGEAFGVPDPWGPHSEPPFYNFQRLTAYPGYPNTISDPAARRLAWLADLHYWIILAFLDRGYRDHQLKYRYSAIDTMTLGLWWLGLHLARAYGVGVPFDPMSTQVEMGRTPSFASAILARLIREAETVAKGLAEDHLLPPDYDLKLFRLTLDALEST